MVLWGNTLQQKKVKHKLLQAFIFVKPRIIKHAFYACISYIFHPYLVLIMYENQVEVTGRTQDKM